MRDLTPERLTRLLAMIAYFGDGRAVPVAEAAEHFGVSRSQLLKDIDTLWVSGAPGYEHGDLIDFEATALEEGIIQLRDAQQMDRPLRLSAAEAVTLLAALNSLIARLGQSEVLISTRRKLQLAAGQAAHAADAVLIERTSEQMHALREEISNAIETKNSLQLTYVSGHGEVTERTVNPEAIHASADDWVLMAWCHRAEAPRQFRLDRIMNLQTLAETFTPDPAMAAPAAFDTSAFEHTVTLRLTSRAKWVTEQIPLESFQDDGDTFTVAIASNSTSWLEQLCLRLGNDLISIDPPEVRSAVARRAQHALAMYEE